MASTTAAAIWGEAIFYRLIYVWGFLLISSYIWTFFSLKNINVARKARTMRQQVGQIFEERFEVQNLSRFARLWIAVRDLSPLPGSAGSRVQTWIGGNSQRTYISYSWLTHRGLFLLGPTEISSGDLFGLFTSTQVIPSPGSLLVTPFMVDLQTFPSPTGLLPGGRTLHHRTLEVTPYAASVREYSPGDPLNRIHWVTTARRDQLMVKEFEQDPQADVWIFLDAYHGVQAALPEAEPIIKADRLLLWRHKPEEIRLPSATFEYAISVAASVANYFINQNHAVGLASAGRTYNVLPAERGERQLGKILETLSFIDAEGKLPLTGLTTAQASYLPRGSTVVLVTPSTQESLLLAVNDLDKRSMHPVVVLIDAASFGGLRGSDQLAAELTVRSVPVMVVANHDNLEIALQSTSTGSSAPVAWWMDPDAASLSG
ncbi:MAG: DUF58 domain-containing protein [Anaerolineaceae bacterium]|nr:DUF58 domain-containing protein [Anaerolineaceae bacterium]